MFLGHRYMKAFLRQEVTVSDIHADVISRITSSEYFALLNTSLQKIPYFHLISCGKAQFPHSLGRITRNYAETLPFHKISTPGNWVKLRYFLQCLISLGSS